MTGFVSFVGSGPGDPELLTLKAVDRLKNAEAVLFDDLSSGPILAHAGKGADLVGVGKRAGRASPKQSMSVNCWLSMPKQVPVLCALKVAMAECSDGLRKSWSLCVRLAFLMKLSPAFRPLVPLPLPLAFP